MATESIDDGDQDSALESVQGTVVNHHGHPLASARLVVRRFDSRSRFDEYLHCGEKFSELDRNFANGQSNRQGQFLLPLNRIPNYAALAVIAHQPGYAPQVTAWHGTACELRLSPGVAIRGSVMDQDNRPIAGARVRLMSWFRYAENQASLAKNHDTLALEGHLVDDSIRIETKTGLNGSFGLGDLPEDRWVVLAITAADFQPRCVVIDTGSDPALETACSATRIFDQGVVRMQRATSQHWEVIAQDTGHSVPLRSAWTSPRNWLETNDPLTERARSLPVQENRVTWDAVPPGMHRVWLVPEPATGYLATALDIDGDDPNRARKQQVTASPGVRVFGHVIDHHTEAPLAGAAIHYEADSEFEWMTDGSCVPAVVSDHKGAFSMVVPAVGGWLRQIGRVDGYRSVHFDFSVDIRAVAPTVRIAPVMGDEPSVEFRLQPASRVRGQVVDSEGRPVRYAKYAATDRVTQRSYSDVAGVADEAGRFELPNVFAEILVSQANVEPASPEKIPFERIYFSSPDWNQTATVELPYPVANAPDYDVQVRLVPASSISGRVIDQETGQGVADVQVGTWYRNGPSSRPFNRHIATTDRDGNFRLSPVFANSVLALWARGEYIGHRRNQNDWRTVEAGCQLEIGEIPVYVYRDLEQLLELPDITNLTTLKAYEKLRTALIRIRSKIDEVADWQGARNSMDSISQAETVAAERFGEAFLKLSQQTPDRELRLTILSELLLNLDPSWAPTFFARRAKQSILDQFLDHEQLPALLPRMIGSHETKHWQHVFDYAKQDQLKAIACVNLMQEVTWKLPWMVYSEGTSDQQFSEELRKAERLWTEALGRLADHAVQGETLGRNIEHHLRSILREVESKPPANTRRTEQLQQAIRRHLPTPSGG